MAKIGNVNRSQKGGDPAKAAKVTFTPPGHKTIAHKHVDHSTKSPGTQLPTVNVAKILRQVQGGR
jgi:hypothetical protein